MSNNPRPRRYNKKNAFYFFMKEYKQNNPINGFDITQEDIKRNAVEIWNHMDHEDKEKYYKLEQEYKEKRNGLTSLGEKIADVMKSEQQARILNKMMIEDIQNLILDNFTKAGFANLFFYIIHINFYICGSIHNNYLPAEIAIIRFSLRNGIDLDDTFNIIIDHNGIDLGYRLLAEKLSENTHQIPIPPHKEDIGSRKYCPGIFKQILSFLQKYASDDGTYPPLYAETEEQEAVVKSVLQKFCNETNFDMDILRVYSLPDLFYYLRNAAHRQLYNEDVFISRAIAANEFDRDVYDYVKGICCEFHSLSEGYPHCSLGKVIKAAFTICDHCNADLDIDLIPGYHVPRNAILPRRTEKRPPRVKIETLERILHQIKIENDHKDKTPVANTSLSRPITHSHLIPTEVNEDYNKPGPSSKSDNVWAKPMSEKFKMEINTIDFPELQTPVQLGKASSRTRGYRFHDSERRKIIKNIRNGLNDQVVPDIDSDLSTLNTSNNLRPKCSMGRGRGRFIQQNRQDNVTEQ